MASGWRHQATGAGSDGPDPTTVRNLTGPGRFFVLLPVLAARSRHDVQHVELDLRLADADSADEPRVGVPAGLYDSG